MKQIRVCRSERISHLKQDFVTYGEWEDATPGMVSDCEAIVQAGVEIFGPGSHWIETRELPPTRPRPEVAINALIDESMQAWNAGDLDRHLSYFTPGAIFVTPAGTCHRGHDGLRGAFAREHAAMPGRRMTVLERQVTHPGQDTAIVLMEGTLLHSGLAEPQPWASTQVLVFTPQQRWRIASLHVFHVREPAARPAESLLTP